MCILSFFCSHVGSDGVSRSCSGRLALDEPPDGCPEGFPDGTVNDEVDGAVENQKKVDEVD